MQLPHNYKTLIIIFFHFHLGEYSQNQAKKKVAYWLHCLIKWHITSRKIIQKVILRENKP